MRLIVAAIMLVVCGSALQAQGSLRSIVWVNAGTKVYHCADSKFYGTTNDGEYMTEASARARGNRAAQGAGCAKVKPVPLRPARVTEVWVNTAEKVYHCPGTPSYGKTERGRFMSESAARAAGAAPAGKRTCRG